jgi:hypothetical protein
LNIFIKQIKQPTLWINLFKRRLNLICICKLVIACQQVIWQQILRIKANSSRNPRVHFDKIKLAKIRFSSKNSTFQLIIPPSTRLCEPFALRGAIKAGRLVIWEAKGTFGWEAVARQIRVSFETIESVNYEFCFKFYDVQFQCNFKWCKNKVNWIGAYNLLN